MSAYDRFRGRKVRDFVPLLVERFDDRPVS
ncbi:three-helix bundle dimerization domain-containing protein [Rhodococcus sp. T2V]